MTLCIFKQRLIAGLFKEGCFSPENKFMKSPACFLPHAKELETEGLVTMKKEKSQLTDKGFDFAIKHNLTN